VNNVEKVSSYVVVSQPEIESATVRSGVRSDAPQTESKTIKKLIRDYMYFELYMNDSENSHFAYRFRTA